MSEPELGRLLEQLKINRLRARAAQLGVDPIDLWLAIEGTAPARQLRLYAEHDHGWSDPRPVIACSRVVVTDRLPSRAAPTTRIE